MVDLRMDKNLIPLPPHQRRHITPAMKPEGVGWDDLGPRPLIPHGGTLHRMQGSLWGTDSYFRRADIGALTDWGVDHQTGEMIQWVPDGSRMSGWASGRVSAPFGDGKAYLDAYGPRTGLGANVVNWGRVSMEVSGFFVQPGEPRITADSPWSELSVRRVAQWTAHYAHNAGIPWSAFPIVPWDGFSWLCWHIEFTRGTGKVCPGRVVREQTGTVIQLAQDLLKAAQTGGSKPSVPPFELVYPVGMTRAVAEEAFGRVERTGTVYSFNPAGAVSRLWLDLGATRAKAGQPPEFPRLEDVFQTPIGGKEARYFRFSNGLLLYRRIGERAIEVVGGNPNAAAA